MAELNMALLLKESLNSIRWKLGKDCTYLAFEKEGDLPTHSTSKLPQKARFKHCLVLVKNSN